jgi:hypothetical protein
MVQTDKRLLRIRTEMRLVDQVSSVIHGITKVCCKIRQGEHALSTTSRSCRTLVDWSQGHLLGYVQGTCHAPLPPTMTATLCTGSPCGPEAARRAGPVPTVPCTRAPSYQPIGTHCSASTCAVPYRPRAELWPSTCSSGSSAAAGGWKDRQVMFQICTRRAVVYLSAAADLAV